MTGSKSALPPFCCPLCKGPVEPPGETEEYRCTACDRTYPVVLGIPDFRVWSDPYIEAGEDWAKGERVLREAGDRGFRSMVEHYWRLTPGVPAPMVARFTRYALVGAARGRSRLDRVAEVRGAALSRTDTLLDLGCGTGGLVLAASDRARTVVGVDIAARWLVIARRQLEEAGVGNVSLVCACAEHLPFPDDSFDVVVANDVLEHSGAPAQLLAESHRTLRPDGMMLMATQNRWSLRGEPHVGVWGVGFLPRRWMSLYVRLVRGVPYRFIRLVSAPELDRLLQRVGFKHVRHLLPVVAPDEVEGLSAADLRLVAIYRLLVRLPPLRAILMLLGPALEVAARPVGQGWKARPVPTSRVAV